MSVMTKTCTPPRPSEFWCDWGWGLREGGVGNEKEETQRDDRDSHPEGNRCEASQPEGDGAKQCSLHDDLRDSDLSDELGEGVDDGRVEVGVAAL
eukprot:3933892-Rhodomonas_salina.1